MSDLTDFGQHARTRADWQPGEPRTPCRLSTPFGYPKDPDHLNCGGGGCGCECHAPTDAERVMWKRLADEIDRYLGVSAPMSSEDAPLFEDETT